ncbi:MAG: phosphotransferase [Propionicimonas sp.]
MDELPARAWIPGPEAEAWRHDMLAWTGAVLAGLGLEITAMPTVHKRAPWSVVLRLPTSGGLVWFKENVPSLGPEPTLLRRLSELVPGRVPAPLAIEPGRGWLLLPDQGQTVRARGRDDDPAVWVEVVSEWFEVTRRLAAHADHLADIGVPRLAPLQAAGYARERIGQLSSLPASDPAHLAAADAERLTAVLPAIAQAGEQLAGLGLPDTLWHNDLHTNNVFDGQSGLVFFDLADALIGSPLADLLIPLRSQAHARAFDLALGADDLAEPGLRRTLEAAIEPWTDLVPAADLRAAVPAALMMGVLGRSESWRRAVPEADAAARRAYGGACRDWLLELAGGSAATPL